MAAKHRNTPEPPEQVVNSDETSALLRELVRTSAKTERSSVKTGRRITRAALLTAMTEEEIFAEATSVYDNYAEALMTGTLEALQAYARNLSERIIPRGVENARSVVGIVLLLRRARSLAVREVSRRLHQAEPHSRRVRTGRQPHREHGGRRIRARARARHSPATGGHPRAVDAGKPVRERLLILPIIGVIDPQRARQLTEQLLRAIRANRAKVVVIDITGVAAMDSNVANNLVQTVEAARLLGATVIVTGLSPEIAQTLVTIGVDLSEMATVGDLQGGIEEAERLAIRN